MSEQYERLMSKVKPIYADAENPWHSHIRRTDCNRDCDPATFNDYAYERKAERPPHDIEEEHPSWTWGLEVLSANAEAALSRAERAEGLLERLTPGGSEFVGSPQRCYEWAQERITEGSRLLVTATKERRRAEERLARVAEWAEWAKSSSSAHGIQGTVPLLMAQPDAVLQRLRAILTEGETTVSTAAKAEKERDAL